MKCFLELIERIPAKKYFILLLILGVITLFGGIWIRPLAGGDETRVAGISSEIALNGNFIVPKLNGENFLEYPPLYYDLQVAAFRIFGRNDAAAKLPSAFGGLLALISVWGIARVFSKKPLDAFLCGILLLFSAQFFETSRESMVDPLLAGFVACAVWMALKAIFSRRRLEEFVYFLVFSVSCGCGILTKGILGVVFPCAIIAPWILADDFFSREFRFSRYALLGAGVLVSLIIPGIWLCQLLYTEGYDAVYEVAVVNTLGRFTGTQGDHLVPWYYYLQRLPAQFAPWTILLPFALCYHIRNVWKRTSDAHVSLFLLCGLLVPYLLLTMSATKRQVYLLPLYAIEALMIGTMVADFLSGRQKLPFTIPKAERIIAVLPYLAGAVLCVSGIVFGCMANAGAYLFPGLTLLSGLFLLFARGKRKMEKQFLAALLGTSFLFVSLDAGPLYNRDKGKAYFLAFQRMKAEIQKNPPERVVLLEETAHERLRGAVVYYLGRTVPVSESPGKGDFVIYLYEKEIFWKRME